MQVKTATFDEAMALLHESDREDTARAAVLFEETLAQLDAKKSGTSDAAAVARRRETIRGLVTALQWSSREDDAMAVAANAVARGIWRDPYQRPLDFDTSIDSAPFPVADLRTERAIAALEANADRVGLDALMAETRSAAMLACASDDAAGENLTSEGNWSTFNLSSVPSDVADIEFPLLANLVRSVLDEPIALPILRARLSTLAGGTTIRAHCGPTNARWTLHLGLDVPPESDGGALFIEVKGLRQGAVRRRWENGRVLLFDDSFEHAVVHEGSSPRTVLHIDFVAPARAAELEKADGALRRASSPAARIADALSAAARSSVGRAVGRAFGKWGGRIR